MPISIPDSFDANPGQFANYTCPAGYDTNTLNTIVANQHIDLRAFRNSPLRATRPQSDLDILPQFNSTPSADSMDEYKMASGPYQLDYVQLYPSENWFLASASGITSGTNGLSIRRHPNRNNWRCAYMVCDGTQLNMTLESNMSLNVSAAVDISSQDNLSFVIADYNADFLSAANGGSSSTACYVRLSSHVDGLFIDSNTMSNAVTLDNDTTPSATATFTLPLSLFTSGLTNNFKLSQITGVQIHLQTTNAARPAVNTVLSVMEIRAVKNSWVYKTLDFDTTSGAIIFAVNPTGAEPAAPDAFLPMLRGTTPQGSDSLDPRPTDTALFMNFQTGALSGGTNSIDLIFREKRDTLVSTTWRNGSWLVARLNFSASATSVQTLRYTCTNGVIAAPTVVDSFSGLPLLTTSSDTDPAVGNYLWQVDLAGTMMRLTIQSTDISGGVLQRVWSATSNKVSYTVEQGRCGWFASFADGDSALTNFSAAVSTYATVRTKVSKFRTPVDGAQIVANYSTDRNLFQFMDGPNFEIDTSKTTSGRGSYLANDYIFSNAFFVDVAWKYMYLDFDIWVPAEMTTSNQPYLILQPLDGGATLTPPAMVLQPNQWNSVHYDLGIFSDQLAGYNYELWLSQPANPQPQYAWWLDNIVVGQQLVSFQMRANSDPTLPWREFGQMVGEPWGALHLPHNERGTDFQIQAVALSQDASVSDFTVFPRVSQLGKPTYYVM